MTTRALVSCVLLSALICVPTPAFAKPKATVTRTTKAEKKAKKVAKYPKTKAQKSKKQTVQELGYALSRKLSGRAMRNASNVLDKKYFSSSLVLGDKARDIAMATQEVAFVKAGSKNVVTCRYNYMAGKSTLTKFNKEEHNLFPVKSEEYSHFIDGPQKCIRKGLKGRSALPLSEGIARAMKATTSPTKMSILSPIDLYNSVTPTWIIADSAEDVAEWVQNLEEDQANEGIAPQMRDDLVKPVCIVTIKGDLFLDTVDQELWNKLERSYNMTTFLNHDMRTHFWETKDKLVEARKIAKSGLDLNPNLLEGIFADLEEASCYFSHKGIVRNTLKEISKKVFVWGIPALITLMLYKGLVFGYNWATAPSAAQKAAKEAEEKTKTSRTKARELLAAAAAVKLNGHFDSGMPVYSDEDVNHIAAILNQKK